MKDAGSAAVYGACAELWTRHNLAVTRYARQFGSQSAAEDLVSEAFARLLRVLQAGGGPDMNVRPYLLTAIRRIRIDIATRYEKRVGLTGEDAELDLKAEPAQGADSAAMEALEARTVWKAYNSLPERWKTVLWHTLVEEQQPAAVAPLLGSSPNAVAALSMRAREGLRQAFLQAHVAETDRSECQKVLKRLGAWERRALSTREAAQIEEHLADCDRCTAAAMEVGDLNRSMRVIILPILLGGSALAVKYLTSIGAHAAAVAAASGATASGTAGGGAAGGGPAGAHAAGAGHSGHAVLTKVVHFGTHLAPKSLALAGTSLAVATGAFAMYAILQPTSSNQPLTLPASRTSPLSSSAPAVAASASPTRVAVNPAVPPKASPSSTAPSMTASPPARVISILAKPAASSEAPKSAARATRLAPAPAQTTAPTSSAAPSVSPSTTPSTTTSNSPSTSPSSSPSASPSTSPSTSTSPTPTPSETTEPAPTVRTIPIQYPGATSGGVGTITISGPSDWQITSLTGAAPDSCQVTGPNTATCTIAPSSDPNVLHQFTLVIQSAHPSTGDNAALTYTDDHGLIAYTVPLD
ncbi:MAG: polymerase sigma factor [Frankiales bacterium]|nr:polymerase sigma factor [Frankiales bacterium]